MIREFAQPEMRELCRAFTSSVISRMGFSSEPVSDPNGVSRPSVVFSKGFLLLGSCQIGFSARYTRARSNVGEYGHARQKGNSFEATR